MRAPAPGRPLLHARRLRAEYLVAREHHSAEGVRSALDATVARDLPRILAAALQQRIGADDPSIWMVRRLEVEVTVDAGWEPDRLAGAWAAGIADALDRLLEAGEDGVNVRRFAGAAAQLAEYLADLADGSAHARWYHASFSGLRPLPEAVALRAAVLHDPATGLEALLALAPATLTRVLERLTGPGSRRVLEGLSRIDTGAARTGDLKELLEAYAALRDAPEDAAERERLALRLFLETCRDGRSPAGAGLAAAARAVAELARLAVSGAAAASGLRRHAERAEIRRALLLLVRSDPELGAALGESAQAAVDGVCAALEPTGTAAGGEPGPGAAERRHTRFGGLFLLAPQLAALPLAEATDGWPPCAGHPPEAAVRLLVAAKCLRGARAAQLVSDPVVRDALGIGPSLSRRAVAEWTSLLSPAQMDGLERRLAEGLGTDAPLALACPRPTEGPVAVLTDAGSGAWLTVRGHRPGSPDGLVRALAPWLTGTRSSRPLIVPSSLVARIREAFPGLGVEDAADPPEGDAGAPPVARLERLPRDLEHLALPRSLRGSRRVDLALSVAAHRVLRSFARRLPGFAQAGPEHLWAGFLDVPATVEAEETRWIVRLGRSPLDVILSMTGAARTSYTLPWLDDRPLMIYPAEQ